MTSRLIKVLGVLVIVVLSYLDTRHHGHFSDARIQDEVTQALLRAGFNGKDEAPVRVLVKDNFVTLDGSLPDPKRRDLLPSILDRVAGIRGLTNNVIVAGCNDAVLKNLQEFIKTYGGEAQISYLIEPPCMVTLTGWVPTEEMRSSIGSLAESINGVNGVKNEIEVGQPKRKLEDILVSILNVQNIYFDFNLATIRAESLPSLDKIAEVLKQYSDKKLTIEGHTDNVGSDAYNLKLSDARANAVRDALLKRGVPATQVDAIGYGETRPIAPNTTPETRAENRRIEFKVS